jgi:outer membrane receptor protein involved in Fe transport
VIDQGEIRMTRTVSWYGSVRAWTSSVLAAALLSLAILTPVVAAQAANDDTDELEEVQITGTRIQTPGATSANPIMSITGEEMRQLGIVNVADALLQLVPQNISQYQPGLVGDIQTTSAGEFGNIGTGFGNGTQGNNDLDRGSFFVGQTIANLRGLDPAFGTRTLTLVDGRRVVSSSSQADVVDMNIIPSNLLQRMDVVTGGASATYGSGAMAGVVNLVLNNRLTGFNLDMDYGINEAGDGGSPHISASGGLPLFGGRGHALLGVEWQRTSPILDCAAARDWCRESRTMLTNSASSLTEENYNQPLIPLLGYENYPARFQAENMRYSQFSPNGVIYSNLAPNAFNDPANPRPTSGVRFTADGTGVEPFAYGFRGASNQSSVMNGDGPVTTSGSSMRSGNVRKTMFSNLEFNINERTTTYLQTNYSKTHGENKNRYTMGTVCARFNTQGVRGAAGGSATAGTIIYFGTGTITADQFVVPVSPYNQPITPGMVRNALWSNANFRAWLAEGGGTTLPALIANGITNRAAPYIQAVNSPNNVADLNPVVVPAIGTNSNPRVLMTNGGFSATIPTVAAPGASAPVFTFGPNVVPGSAKYILAKSNNSNSRYWLLTEITLAADFFDPGTPDILPTEGRNSYAFLNTLNADALNAVQAAFSNSPTAGDANSTTRAVWGQDPCAGFTAIRKVWNPQIQQYTTNDSETWRVVAGIRGRFGRDWRYDAYYQYGSTESLSKTFNGASNLSLGFAMEAVIDDRALVNGQPNPTFGQPVCRITRDGVPQADTQGNPMSDPVGLGLLAEGCRPLNIFGDFSQTPAPAFGMSSEELAEMQRDALMYAFKDSSSEGATTRQTLSLTTNGTLWQGWGAGPLTAAFGAEVSGNTVDNKGTRGDPYRRIDLSNWQDSFGGTTRSTEGYTELNMPLVSGVPGANLWSLNLGGRYTSFYNKGGEGTAVDANGKHLSNTQGTFNWKVGMVFEPFDFIRLRMTRSRDMRAAGYRELFLNQPTLPDQAQGRNWWRERTELSDENQGERFGYVRVGNPNLKPESSDTLTLGLVLSPGGWAQGMRFTADYSNQKVNGGIYTPYQFQDAATIIESCWRQSGNNDDPDNYIQGIAPDMDLATCREITFARADDGSIDPTDILWVNSSRPDNGLSYQQRNIDFAWQYMLPLSRAFEELPGNISLSIRASRALEASGIQQGVQQRVTSTGELNCTGTLNADGILICNETQTRINLVGQIRSSQSVPGVSPRPKWSGNFSLTYLLGDLTTSISARYIGGAKQDNTWCDAIQQAEGMCYNYMDEVGRYLGGSVDSNFVKPYLNFALNGSYNLRVGDMKQFQVFGSINNLFNKDPPFTGGGSLSGASAGYHDTMGRAYRMGVRLKF